MVKDFAIAVSAARTTNGQSIDFTNDDPVSIGACRFVIDVTVVAGTTPALTVFVEEYDPVSNKYYTVLPGAAISAVSTVTMSVGPGFPVTPTISANTLLRRNFRIRWTITGTTPSFTFSIGGSVS